ncbi:ABC transporter ATP-binding protein, partial [Actibacterium sp.]|uniref:ABC transporter ATP-binding protein n=1 Tax=Actibacterium sp. TaxID=1872125 RepID=UPI003562DF72
PGFQLGPINLEIAQGEFFGIFGPPSTGKTSILKLILGLLKPDEGQIMLGVRDAANLDAAERDIAMVFQNLALFPHMTGRENIVFPLSERGAPEAEIAERLDFVSEVLHVSHILHKNPSQMSGGERQRIALGRAFAADTRAMLLDEPIAALDARLREEMRVELKRLQRENNQTFVYVSHDEEEVMAISDRVAVVIAGQIAQIGSPDDVYSRPNSLAVAEVIGSPPMNFFKGRFTDTGTGFLCDRFTTACPVPKAPAGAVATLGVRPEDIWLDSDSSDFSVEVTVSSTEPLGGYTIVNVTLGNQILKVRAPGQVDFADGAKVKATFDQRRLHLFDEGGQRL